MTGRAPGANAAQATEAFEPPVVSPAVLRWAGSPGATALLEQVREKLERGARGPRVKVGANLTAKHRSDVGRLLGGRWEVSGAPVTFGALRERLAPEIIGTTADVLEMLLTVTSGPVRNLSAEKLAARDAKSATAGAIVATLSAAGVPDAVAELAVRRRWLIADESGVAQAAAIGALFAYLADGGAGLLAEVANHLYDDPHALDRGTDLGRTAVRVLAGVHAWRDGSDPHDVAAATEEALVAARWRDTWFRGGVACDRVSATVLVLNLPLAGEAAAVALTGAARQVGEPVWLTSRSLVGSWAPDPDVTVVRVCENPSVIEKAADELGAECPPLVCTYGRPSTAAHALLRGLAAARVRLLVSADRDTAGDQIAAEVLAYPDAAPWEPSLDGLYEEARLHGLIAEAAAGTSAPEGRERSTQAS